jgi:cytochrome P450
LIAFDPRDNSIFADGRHHAVFSQLRENDTLSVDENGPVPIYSLVAYDDVTAAYKDTEVFSPSAGLTLDSFDPSQPESLQKMLETAAPERHGELRGAMQGAFRGASLRQLQRRTDELLERFLAAAPDEEAVDFVAGFAREAAAMTICELLGVRAAEAERLDPLLAALGSFGADLSPEAAGQRMKGELWLLHQLNRIARAHRREEGGEGVVGRLLGTEVGGEALDDHEVALNCLNVVVAGTGATLHTLSAAAAVWAEHPGALDAVAGEKERSAGLIEETLRWLTPVVHLTRIATTDVELPGGRIPAGAGACLWNVAANRDGTVFEEPDRFYPDRPPRRHLAFGTGPQHCLGAQVVRLQLGLLLEALVENGVRLEPAGEAVWIRNNTITGAARVPVRIRR